MAKDFSPLLMEITYQPGAWGCSAALKDKTLIFNQLIFYNKLGY